MHSFCNCEKSKTADFLPGALRVKKKIKKNRQLYEIVYSVARLARSSFVSNGIPFIKVAGAMVYQNNIRVSISLLSLNELPIEIYAVVKPKTIFFFKLDPCNVLAGTVTRFLVRYIRKSKFCLILTMLNSVKFIFRGLRVFSVTPFLVDVTFLLLAE